MKTRIPVCARCWRMSLSLALATLFLLATGVARAEVSVSDAWARATVPQQKAGGAYMNLLASEDTRLVGVSTPAAEVAEIHEMKMEDGIMKMRAIDGLDLPAGQRVELSPGGYHLMLMQLHGPLQEGSAIPVSLQFENAAGERSTLVVEIPVRPLTSPAPAAHGHGHGAASGTRQ